MEADLVKRFMGFAHHDFGIVMAAAFFGIGVYQILKTPNRSKKGFFDYLLAAMMILFGFYILNIHFGFF